MSRGHKHDPIYSLSINARFSVQFFFKKKIVMEKKKNTAKRCGIR